MKAGNYKLQYNILSKFIILLNIIL